MQLLYVTGCHRNQVHVWGHGAGLRAPAGRYGGGEKRNEYGHLGNECANGGTNPERLALCVPKRHRRGGRLLSDHVIVVHVAVAFLALDHPPECALAVDLQDLHPIRAWSVHHEANGRFARPVGIGCGTQRDAGLDEVREVGRVPLAPAVECVRRRVERKSMRRRFEHDRGAVAGGDAAPSDLGGRYRLYGIHRLDEPAPRHDAQRRVRGQPPIPSQPLIARRSLRPAAPPREAQPRSVGSCDGPLGNDVAASAQQDRLDRGRAGGVDVNLVAGTPHFQAQARPAGGEEASLAQRLPNRIPIEGAARNQPGDAVSQITGLTATGMVRARPSADAVAPAGNAGTVAACDGVGDEPTGGGVRGVNLDQALEARVMPIEIRREAADVQVDQRVDAVERAVQIGRGGVVRPIGPVDLVPAVRARQRRLIMPVEHVAVAAARGGRRPLAAEERDEPSGLVKGLRDAARVAPVVRLHVHVVRLVRNEVKCRDVARVREVAVEVALAAAEIALPPVHVAPDDAFGRGLGGAKNGVALRACDSQAVQTGRVDPRDAPPNAAPVAEAAQRHRGHASGVRRADVRLRRAGRRIAPHVRTPHGEREWLSGDAL